MTTPETDARHGNAEAVPNGTPSLPGGGYAAPVVRMLAGLCLVVAGMSAWPSLAETILGVTLPGLASRLYVPAILIMLCGGAVLRREIIRQPPGIARTRLLVRFTLIVAAIAAGILLLELALRLAAPVRRTATVWTPAAEACGWALPPSEAGVEYDLETGARIPFETNSFGWRDAEGQREKPDGVFRVAILGDSQIQGYGLPIEETVAYRLREALLGLGYGPDVEILQMGCEGWGSDQELIALDNRVLPHKPDLVVLSFTLENDPVDNLYPQNIYGLESKPVFRKGQDGGFVLTPAGRRPGLPGIAPMVGEAQIIKRLRIFFRGLLYKIHPVSEAGLPPSQLEARFPDPAARPAVPDYGGRRVDMLRDRAGYSPFCVPESPRITYAWDVTRMILGRMRQVCGEKGVRFVVMEPRGMAYAGSPQMNIAQDGVPICLDFQRGMLRFKKVCDEEGLILLLPPLTEKGCFHPDGHLLPKGNRALAVFLADWLAACEWFPRSKVRK
ncbi:MAG TPA: SGNH/GDSL hydrolase family protein [Candidatus Brocadiia bacterium]|nr:SGNH/GDSL hydrolase family protein [Candidatus Brocadiia bacterium]